MKNKQPQNIKTIKMSYFTGFITDKTRFRNDGHITDKSTAAEKNQTISQNRQGRNLAADRKY